VQFVQALRPRDETAADWLVSTGLFLSDARLDVQELQTMDMILGRKDDPFWYLSHARVLDGLSKEDYAYLQSNDAVPADDWYFVDDVRGLEAFQLLSRDGQRNLQRVFEKGHQDSQVRKGLYLINTLGLPDPRLFKYAVPQYNVQLYLLARLLEQGLPMGYERVAVAAAVAYGSLATLCDQAVREQVVAYAGERVRLLIDTDVLLSAAGSRWRAGEYPIEALVLVLWGGQSAAYPQAGVPLAKARSLRAAASDRPLGADDLARLLVPLDSLRQMQDEMIRVAVERTTDPAVAYDLIEQWWSTHRREEADEGGPDMGRQWARFRDGRGFAGGTEAGYVLQGLAASINIPIPWAQLWYAHQGQLRTVPFGFRLDPASRTLRPGSSAQRAIASLPPETRAVLVWWRVPWDNWHLPDDVRSPQTVPMPLSVWQGGVPAGYLLRQGVAKESDTLAALGIK